jgi:hypothetical protein
VDVRPFVTPAGVPLHLGEIMYNWGRISWQNHLECLDACAGYGSRYAEIVQLKRFVDATTVRMAVAARAAAQRWLAEAAGTTTQQNGLTRRDSLHDRFVQAEQLKLSRSHPQAAAAVKFENDEILVPSSLIGVLIGRQGATISEYQQLSGAKINVLLVPTPGRTLRACHADRCNGRGKADRLCSSELTTEAAVPRSHSPTYHLAAVINSRLHLTGASRGRGRPTASGDHRRFRCESARAATHH